MTAGETVRWCCSLRLDIIRFPPVSPHVKLFFLCFFHLSVLFPACVHFHSVCLHSCPFTGKYLSSSLWNVRPLQDDHGITVGLCGTVCELISVHYSDMNRWCTLDRHEQHLNFAVFPPRWRFATNFTSRQSHGFTVVSLRIAFLYQLRNYIKICVFFSI